MKRRLAMTLALALAASLPLFAQDNADAGAPKEDKRADHATDKGLEFLARTQNPDGSWTSPTFGKNTGITALAAMAFMAKGNIPGEGPYGEQLNRAIDYVLDSADPKTGMLVAHGATSQGPMYSHGICTLMLAEAVGMTQGDREKRIRAALERAVKLTLAAQQLQRKDPRQQGGWRYQSSSRDSDLSCTGWQLMSLRAAKNAGADVPIEAINEAVAYVKRSACKGGGFAYQPGGGPNRARTGTGILSLELCGRHMEKEAVAGADWLIKNPPAWPDQFFYYGSYYCAQAMFQMGDRYWDFWRPRLESLLLSLQREDGSWPPSARGDSETRAGDVYFTAMACLALSVKYHCLPIYQR